MTLFNGSYIGIQRFAVCVKVGTHETVLRLRRCSQLVCLAALVIAFALGTGSAKAGLLSFAIVGGYFANLMAVLVSAFLIVVVVLRGRTGKAGTTLRANWLGVVSAAVVVLAWSVYFAVGTLRP